MKKIMFVQHIDPTLSAVLKASIAWENTRVWIGTVAGIYQELSKELYQEVSPDVSDEKPFSSGQQAPEVTSSEHLPAESEDDEGSL